jgi:hypothetical protein
MKNYLNESHRLCEMYSLYCTYPVATDMLANRETLSHCVEMSPNPSMQLQIYALYFALICSVLKWHSYNNLTTFCNIGWLYINYMPYIM